MLKPLTKLEAELIANLAPADALGSNPAVFVLGAPRTGSTILYQAFVSVFGLPYFSNLVNEYFAVSPIVGLLVQSTADLNHKVAFHSHYGKTEGLFEPSEASRVMRHWFGGGHPSQVVSAQILPGKELHLVRTVASAFNLFDKPLVIKNAWNCFRVPCLAQLLPAAFFVWIRRDIAAAAKSDLHARYSVKDSPTAWNSATPHNVEALRLRPHWEQVVENQYEFSVALDTDLNAHAKGRFVEIWYEDFCADPIATMRRIASAWPELGEPVDLGERWAEVQRSSERWDLSPEDGTSIDTYVQASAQRFSAMRYQKRTKTDDPHGKKSRVMSGRWHLQRVTPESLEDYLRRDWVQDWLAGNSQPGDDSFTAQRWLTDSPPKRHIFAALYGDLLQTSGQRILDVGGGLSAVTRELARRHRYELVELLAHEVNNDRAGAAGRLDGYTLHHCDWLDFQPGEDYDVIIANDLLPNVDQRLELFLNKFLPRCRELRMSLTFFDAARYYQTRRIGGDEILYMLAWTWEQVCSVIERVGGQHLSPQLNDVGLPTSSIFPNGRHVVLLTARAGE